MKDSHIREYVKNRKQDSFVMKVLGSVETLREICLFVERNEEDLAFYEIKKKCGKMVDFTFPKKAYIVDVLEYEKVSVFDFFRMCKEEQNRMNQEKVKEGIKEFKIRKLDNLTKKKENAKILLTKSY